MTTKPEDYKLVVSFSLSVWDHGGAFGNFIAGTLNKILTGMKVVRFLDKTRLNLR